MSSRPATIGQLRDSGWESAPVKEEVRRRHGDYVLVDFIEQKAAPRRRAV